MIMFKKHLLLLTSVILACFCASCEAEEDFGFPSKIEISGKGESIDIKGSNDLPPAIVFIELLNYDTTSRHTDRSDDWRDP